MYVGTYNVLYACPAPCGIRYATQSEGVLVTIDIIVNLGGIEHQNNQSIQRTKIAFRAMGHGGPAKRAFTW